MTDGCGFINRAGMMEITRKMKYASRPTAVQGRIAGAKGLWILDSSRDEDHLPRIWIRDSQNKIKYINYKDKSLRIFELLCVSQPSPPISLSSQTILNLNFNGIPKETLITLLEKGIEDEVTPLTDWNKPMPCLWDAIAKAGHVANTRAQRYATAGRSRALGLSRREWGPDFLKNEDAIPEGDDSEMNVDDDAIGAEYTGRNEHSGSELGLYCCCSLLIAALEPFGLQEFVLELIQAGFKPTELTVLRDKIRFVVQQTIDSAIEKYRIPLQESISAFVVPGRRLPIQYAPKMTPSTRPFWNPQRRTNILLFITTFERFCDADVVHRPERASSGKHSCLNVGTTLITTDLGWTVSCRSPRFLNVLKSVIRYPVRLACDIQKVHAQPAELESCSLNEF